MATEILVLMILIVLNAFFAASEIALISLNDNKIRLMAEDGDKKAKLIKNLLSEPSRFFATIQIGITLAGFLASAFASESFADPLVRFLLTAGIPIPAAWLKTAAVFIITIVLSYFTLVLGELVPKRIAMKKSEPIARLVAKPLRILSIITSPIVKFLTVSTNFFVRMLGVDPNAEEKGTIQEAEKEMINNIFEFNNKIVTDIMTHRTDIAALSLTASLNEVVAFINTEKYSRIPVYEDNIDNIIGILHSKSIIQVLTDGSDKTSFSLKDMIKQPYFVPASKRTDELFKELQRSKTHLAVIIDEYGGTAGIVTLEDLIEEIVGNIFDEDDDEERDMEKIDENTFILKGSITLDDAQEALGISLPVDEYETLSGFIIGQLGRIPEKEDKPTIEFNELIFKVEAVDEKKISKVKVCRAS